MAKTAKKTAGKKITASKVTAPAKKAPKKVASEKVSSASKKTTAAKKSASPAKKAISKKAPAKTGRTSKTEKTKLPKKAKEPSAKITKSKKEEEKSPAQIIADAAIHGILEKKGRNVICMDLRNVPNAVCDFFIICEAESTRQVSAIADSVDFEVKKTTGENPFHTEGWENSLWILLDYVNVVIHVFEAETRHFYRLESLWADAVTKEYGIEYA